jgi:hypothetical protein
VTFSGEHIEEIARKEKNSDNAGKKKEEQNRTAMLIYQTSTEELLQLCTPESPPSSKI